MKQEEALLSVQDEQTHSWMQPPGIFIGLSFIHNVYQNIVLSLADCSGIG
jgi:hypothetical protein